MVGVTLYRLVTTLSIWTQVRPDNMLARISPIWIQMVFAKEFIEKVGFEKKLAAD